MSQPENMRAGHATALAASSRPRSLLRAAAAPLRCAPSGDTASAAAKWLTTTGRVLPVVTDRLFTTTAAAASTMPLTSSRQVGRFHSPKAQNHSEYTLFPPSDCPTNQDHLIQSRGSRRDMAVSTVTQVTTTHDCARVVPQALPTRFRPVCCRTQRFLTAVLEERLNEDVLIPSDVRTSKR